MTGRVRNFKCHKCNQSLYVKRYVSGTWIRFMPPKFCPYCGVEVPVKRKEDTE